MPIHIWMPIKLLSPRCDALPVLHVKQNGRAVIICFNYFIFPIYLSVHLFICHSRSWLWRGRAAHALLESDRAHLTSGVWSLLIWLKSAQIKPPSTHPLIGNDRISLNIGINYGGVKLGSHRGAVFRGEKKQTKNHNIAFELYAYEFFFKAMVHHSSCRSLISCLLDSQICRGVRCEPQRDRICLLGLSKYWIKWVSCTDSVLFANTMCQYL